MSISQFQRAFADLIADPQRCVEARTLGAAAFARYELTDRERARLVAMVGHEGMSINCTLYRVNRLTPLYSVLPLTLAWLGERANAELSAFWAGCLDATLQYGREAVRFGAWLEQRVAERKLADGPWRDALAFELAAFAVRTAAEAGHASDAFPHPRKRLLAFRHDPALVLAPTPGALPPLVDAWVLLDAAHGELEVAVLDGAAARALARSG